MGRTSRTYPIWVTPGGVGIAVAIGYRRSASPYAGPQHRDRGRRAGRQHDRQQNVATGGAALFADTTGSNNVATGTVALNSNTD